MSLYAVSRESGESLYVQIARQLEQEIAARHAPGEGLPSEADLAMRFGVNRHTLRRAVDQLVDAGILERRHGRGVFVTDSLLDYHVGARTRFTEALSAQGFPADSRILRNQIVPANERVAQRLALELANPVLWLETLRTVDERPFCIISHFISAVRFPEVGDRYHGGSLHQFLATTYGCVLRRTESLVTAVMPQGDDAHLLGMPQNKPVLRVKSLNVDERDARPVEYAVTRFRGDRIQLCINP